MSMMTLSSMLQRTARLYGPQTAIYDAEGNLAWSAYSNRIARAAGMLSMFGLKPRERFAILCRNCVRQAELIYGGYWSGIVPVPLNYRLAAPEIIEMLDDAQCRLLAIESNFIGLLDGALFDAWRGRSICIDSGHKAGGLPDYDALRDAAKPIEPFDPGENDEAILLFTGGTTGRGKGVPLTHRNIVSNALQLAHAMSLRPDDIYLHSSPMFHSTDLKATALTMIGAGHVYIPESAPINVLEATARYGVTIASLVPTMLRRVLDAPELKHYDLARLRLISYGTSPMPLELLRRAMDIFPSVDMHQCYGLTETSPIVAILDASDHRRGLAQQQHLLRAAGRPLPSVDISIRDTTGRPLPLGASGEIVLRGPQVVQRYHNRPKETSEAFREGWFWTGDIGRLDEEGYLYVLDRKKEMVVTGGENVYTLEVEAALHQHPGISEAAVVGVPDEQYGEALFAAIVLKPGWHLTVDDVIGHCRKLIGGYKIPRRMAFIDSLPRSAMGKVLKQEVRRIHECVAPPGVGNLK
jgi:long-chain acyl-CoA synthetase